MQNAFAKNSISRIEMRNAPRRRILQRCFVLPASVAASDAWRCVAYSMSATGIGIALPERLPEGTVLTIHAWGLQGACSLQVRVVRTKQVESFWFTGCKLTKRLSDVDLRIWCSGPLDWPDRKPINPS